MKTQVEFVDQGKSEFTQDKNWKAFSMKKMLHLTNVKKNGWRVLSRGTKQDLNRDEDQSRPFTIKNAFMQNQNNVNLRRSECHLKS